MSIASFRVLLIYIFILKMPFIRMRNKRLKRQQNMYYFNIHAVSKIPHPGEVKLTRLGRSPDLYVSPEPLPICVAFS